EPLVDLVRRVVEVLAIDIELATAPGPEADLARDNLALFLDAVGCFAGTDPSAGLFGLLAFLDAELERGGGMSVADPGLSDSVKLCTVHAAKGLEWRAVVLPFLAQGVFPSATPRPCWERTAAVVPAPLRGDAAALPRQRSWDKPDRDAYVAAQRAHQLLEERRLAYVAVTRAKEVVVASGHWWGRSQKRPRGPSDHLDTLRAHAGSGPSCWAPAPEQGATNPCLANRPALAFPGRLDEARLHRRRQVADDVRCALVVSAAEAALRDLDLPDLDLPDLDLCGLDADLDALLAEAGAASAAGTVVDLPSSVSATIAARAHTEPQRLARELARPMPRRPSVAARFGTRFHAYLESRFGQQQLIDPDELPGRADSGIDDDSDLAAVIAAFESGPFAERRPDVVEAPFQVVLAGRVVRGRIDAVYRSAGGGYDVVDWKTGHREDADETQLAIYRVACAELYGVPLDRVRARFCFVRTGMVLEPDRLPDRAALEARLFGAAS
ncbi:MAG: PD-(D/E)XK nuclease family protein, partial [Actinomycetota bacterium]|nr:PD-(D/E)XK nuclease family protein [Actinomycetota bacterium]